MLSHVTLFLGVDGWWVMQGYTGIKYSRLWWSGESVCLLWLLVGKNCFCFTPFSLSLCSLSLSLSLWDLYTMCLAHFSRSEIIIIGPCRGQSLTPLLIVRCPLLWGLTGTSRTYNFWITSYRHEPRLICESSFYSCIHKNELLFLYTCASTVVLALGRRADPKNWF